MIPFIRVEREKRSKERMTRIFVPLILYVLDHNGFSSQQYPPTSFERKNIYSTINFRFFLVSVVFSVASAA